MVWEVMADQLQRLHLENSGFAQCGLAWGFTGTPGVRTWGYHCPMCGGGCGRIEGQHSNNKVVNLTTVNDASKLQPRSSCER